MVEREIIKYCQHEWENNDKFRLPQAIEYAIDQVLDEERKRIIKLLENIDLTDKKYKWLVSEIKKEVKLFGISE